METTASDRVTRGAGEVSDSGGVVEGPRLVGSAGGMDGLDALYVKVDARKGEWAALPTLERVAMGRRLMQRYHSAAPAMVAAAVAAKCIPAGSATTAEEWLAGPMCFLRTTRLLLDELERREKPGATEHPLGAAAVSERVCGPGEAHPSGTRQRIWSVCPSSNWDRLLFPGTTAAIWTDPPSSDGGDASTPTAGGAGAAVVARGGEVALVLGAGNVSSIGPLDVVNKLFVESSVCVLKMSPVNGYLAPFFKDAFAEFIERGFLAICGGGAAEGAYLCAHPLCGAIHVTGSAKTHDAILFGASRGSSCTAAEGGGAGPAARPRVNARRTTSELGNVSPIVIVPGRWSAGALQYHAENVASQIANNAAFNCNAGRVIVTSRGWAQRQAFLDALRKVYASRVACRVAYYPGAAQRYRRWVRDAAARGLDVEQLGAVFDVADDTARDRVTHAGDAVDAAPPVLPWTLITDVPSDSTPLLFTEESFCSIQCETALAAGGADGSDVSGFLDAAVAFCNDKLWGSLNACIVIDPVVEIAHKARLESAIAQLRYGTVAVNVFPGIGYGLGTATWGAFPGEHIDAVESGIGVVHNAWLVPHPQKTVLRMPFLPRAVSGRPQRHTNWGPLLWTSKRHPRWGALPKFSSPRRFNEGTQ